MIETAYAKVNVALHVRARRDDGYHALESLFVFAEHGDRLSAVASDDGAIDLIIDGPFGGALEAGPGNLVMKAARALRAYLGDQRGAAIRLTKILPVASGIGGGSADAAATLRSLARLWDVRIEAEELAGLALDLGSDVPACVASVTQMVTGRGERPYRTLSRGWTAWRCCSSIRGRRIDGAGFQRLGSGGSRAAGRHEPGNIGGAGAQ